MQQVNESRQVLLHRALRRLAASGPILFTSCRCVYIYKTVLQYPGVLPLRGVQMAGWKKGSVSLVTVRCALGDGQSVGRRRPVGAYLLVPAVLAKPQRASTSTLPY